MDDNAPDAIKAATLRLSNMQAELMAEVFAAGLREGLSVAARSMDLAMASVAALEVPPEVCGFLDAVMSSARDALRLAALSVEVPK